MSAHPADETFVREGRTIYLRCLDDDGNHMGDLRIAEAVMEAHAFTLTSAANAGMRVFREAQVDAGIRKILTEQPPEGPEGGRP
jgi:glycine cleavage system aminomethyltransferase T